MGKKALALSHHVKTASLIFDRLPCAIHHAYTQEEPNAATAPPSMPVALAGSPVVEQEEGDGQAEVQLQVRAFAYS